MACIRLNRSRALIRLDQEPCEPRAVVTECLEECCQELLARGLIDPHPLHTATIPLTATVEAFARLNTDRDFLKRSSPPAERS
jgi:hypothetical protein